MDRVGIIIQARMSSTRLPGKVLLPLGENVLLDHVISRCKEIVNVSQIVVATTNNEADYLIEQWCDSNNVQCFKGDENDVLERYIQCAEYYQFSHVIRVTSDCPFLDFEVANKVIKIASNQPEFDLISIKENWSRGLAIELVSVKALKKIKKLTNDAIYLEHVTFYIYKNPEFFRHVVYEVDKDRQFPEYRLTVDTPEDYELCSRISMHFKNNLVSCTQIFRFLRDNPTISSINSEYVKITPEMDAKRSLNIEG